MEERRHALLIGNQTYPAPSDFKPLKSPHSDVLALKSVLEDPKHGRFDEVTVLTDAPRSETLIAISEALQKKTKSDLLLIYFSGHGKTNDHNDLFLAASDSLTNHLEATAIDARQVSELMGRSHAEKTILVLDCCHAGAFPVGFKSDDSLQSVANRYAHAGGSYVLMACGEFELARDGDDGELSHLTHHLVRGLQGAADDNEDGVVTVKELTTYLDQVMAKGGGQKFNQSGQNQRGDIVLGWSGKTPLEDVLTKGRVVLSQWSLSGQISDEVNAEVLSYFAQIKRHGQDEADPRWSLVKAMSGETIGSGVFNRDWIRSSHTPETDTIFAPKIIPPVVDQAPEPVPEPVPEPIPAPAPVASPLPDTVPQTKGAEKTPWFLDLIEFLVDDLEIVGWFLSLLVLCLCAGATAGLMAALNTFFPELFYVYGGASPGMAAAGAMLLIGCALSWIWVYVQDEFYSDGEFLGITLFRTVLVVPLALALHGYFDSNIFFEISYLWQ